MDGEVTFGEWLDDQLRQRRWTQTAFAELVGVARPTVSSWINNTQPPRRRAIPVLARALGADVNEVLVRAGYPPNEPGYVLPEHRIEEVPGVYDAATRAADAELLRRMIVELEHVGGVRESVKQMLREDLEFALRQLLEG